jgi:hypothetical protein
MALIMARYSFDESINSVRFNSVKMYDIPDYTFKDIKGENHIIYHAEVNGVFYLRAVDLWRSLTLESGTFFPKKFKFKGEMERVLIGNRSGCPSTRPVYALTIEQALEACKTYALESKNKGAHPVEKWIREKVMPTASASKPRKIIVKSIPETAWTPADVPSVDKLPLPKIIKAVEEPQPVLPELEAAPKAEASNLADYAIWLRRPGEKSREAKGEKWMLPAVTWEGQTLWKRRLAIDINDIRKLVEIRDEDVENLKDCLWAKNGGPKCLVDNLAWQRIKAMPTLKNAPEVIAAFDELFSHEARRLDRPSPERADEEKSIQFQIPVDKTPAKCPPPPSESSPLGSPSEEANKFGFMFNGRHVCNIYAAKDDNDLLWVETKGITPVFGPYDIWPQSIKNARRRTVRWNGYPLAAISELSIAELAQALTPSDKSSGSAFVRWLMETVKPTLKSTGGKPLESKAAGFFFKGVTHEIHVASDDSGELWASVSEIEALLDLKVLSWPKSARWSHKNMMAYNGGRFTAISEEFLDDIASEAPTSRRDRAKAFISWWTKDVWDMFGDKDSQEKPADAPKPAISKGCIADQARDIAQLIVELADENKALRDENKELKDDLAKMEKDRALVSKQKEAIQAALKALSS